VRARQRFQSASMNSRSPNRTATVPTKGSVGITLERHSPASMARRKPSFHAIVAKLFIARPLSLPFALHSATQSITTLDTAKARHNLEIAADRRLHFFQRRRP